MIETIKPKSIVGTIDLFDFDPFHSRAGIGILIGNYDKRRNGYASEALDLLIEYCFTTLNLHQVYCNIGESNTASIRLFLSKNFLQCGERKEWINTSIGWQSELSFQLIRNK
ncbi:MAG: GNAT family N-acetyltransferase [Bacteroidales bacterium]|nr:GNAT family N-acetyltransferase [Bacteroidales bacterium]